MSKVRALQFTKTKNVILFIYDYKCYLCSHTNTSNHVHHVDKNANNNNVFNLMVLCNNCHKLTHKLNFDIIFKQSQSQKIALEKLANFWK